MCALHQAGIRKCFLDQAGMCTASITPEYIMALYEVLPHSSRLCAPSFCWSRVFRTLNHKANGNRILLLWFTLTLPQEEPLWLQELRIYLEVD